MVELPELVVLVRVALVQDLQPVPILEAAAVAAVPLVLMAATAALGLLFLE
jgi:hypothetical protein